MPTTRADDTTAIKKVLADQYDAWAAGDAGAFVADYAEDATVVMPGAYRRNKNEIRESMAGSFASYLKGTRVVDEVQTVRFLGDDHAIAVSKAGILFPGESEAPASRYVYATWVFCRGISGWEVQAYHNSPVETPSV